MTKSLSRVAVTAAGLVVALSLAAPPASGQDRAAAVKSAATKARGTPKTPWGDPDLQGGWSGDSAQAIPMVRPANLAGRAELTDQECQTKVDRDKIVRPRRPIQGELGVGGNPIGQTPGARPSPSSETQQ